MKRIHLCQPPPPAPYPPLFRSLTLSRSRLCPPPSFARSCSLSIPRCLSSSRRPGCFFLRPTRFLSLGLSRFASSTTTIPRSAAHNPLDPPFPLCFLSFARNWIGWIPLPMYSIGSGTYLPSSRLYIIPASTYLPSSRFFPENHLEPFARGIPPSSIPPSLPPLCSFRARSTLPLAFAIAPSATIILFPNYSSGADTEPSRARFHFRQPEGLLNPRPASVVREINRENRFEPRRPRRLKSIERV